ncbi:MAG: hypothetical protein LBM96_01400 [Methanobrevibacter sp.]|jgi:hypothetical protein|nr:hypothetical protein [Candidatus Methanoflexus mossambicus]
MSTIFKILLVILLFIGFFEVGLLSSYTIITSDAPDVKGLVDFQLDYLSSLLTPENINNVLLKDPDTLNVTNYEDTAIVMRNLSNVDGVNIHSLNATTYGSEDKIEVKITGFAYSAPNNTKGQIVISTIPDYKLVATAQGTKNGNSVDVDVDTIKIISIFKIYNYNETISFNFT